MEIEPKLKSFAFAFFFETFAFDFSIEEIGQISAIIQILFSHCSQKKLFSHLSGRKSVIDNCCRWFHG
jgi:hypothetical protein